MNYNEHKDNLKSFHALTGLTHIQFSHLLPYFEAAHDDYLSELSKDGSVQLVLSHDGAEREIIRPVDLDEQKEQYYRKKECHRVKDLVVTTMICLIFFVITQTVSGKTHDKKMADTMCSFSLLCALYQDAYATEKETIKKRGEKEISEKQKEFNREATHIRVRVEHAIEGAKLMRIVKDECRLRAHSFVECIFATCAVLHNLRIKIKPWTYKTNLHKL